MPQPVLDYWPLAVAAIVAVIAAVTDLRSGKIYNALTYPAALLGLIGNAVLGGWAGGGEQIGLAGSLAGLAIGFGPLMLASMAGGINGGDVKLMAAVGALTGWQLTVSTLLYTFAAALLISVVLMLYKRVFWRTLRRIGVFVLQLISLHKPFDPADASSPKVPFGLAVAMGVAAAIVERALQGPHPLSFFGI